MAPMPRARTLLLAVLLLIVLGVGLERLIVTDEERVEQAYAALVAAVEEERAGDLAKLLSAALRYDGPTPVGKGDFDESQERFAEFFDAAHSIRIIRRGTTEITVAPGFATMRMPQIVRFKYGDMFVAYKLDSTLTFDRAGDDWLLSQVDITSLAPGIL